MKFGLVALGFLLAAAGAVTALLTAQADDAPPPAPVLPVVAVEPADKAGSVPPNRILKVQFDPLAPAAEAALEQLSAGAYGLRLQGGGETTWLLPEAPDPALLPAPPGLRISARISYDAAAARLSADPGALRPGSAYTATLAVGDALVPLLSADFGLAAIDPGALPDSPRYTWTFTTAAASVSASVSGGGLNPTLSLPAPGGQPTTIAASGTGTVGLVAYAANPAPKAPGGVSGSTSYFDVYLGAQASFTSLTVSRCGTIAGTRLLWWNGSAWIAVSDQAFDPATGCVNLLASATTSPTLRQLTGTPFSSLLPPVVTSVTPSHGPLGGGTAVTVTGSNFPLNAGVKFGPNQAWTVSVKQGAAGSPDTLTTYAPPGAAPGAVTVTVTNPSLNLSGSRSAAYTYDHPLPVVTAITPGAGPLGGGTQISVTGAGFYAPLSVRVAGKPGMVTVTSATRLVVTAPPGPWTGPADLTVSTPGGTAASPTRFVYQGLSLPVDGGHRVGVPAYFAPGPDWRRFDAAAATAGLAVINPASGPGSSASAAYQSQVSASTARGKAIFGYVPTWYANTAAGQAPPGGSLTAVEAEVDQYYRFYGAQGLAGIFFDQVTSNCTDAGGYYAQLKSYVWNTYRGQVILNPGAAVPECFLAAADVIVNFEGPYDQGVGSYLHDFTPAAWTSRYPASRFWQIVSNTPAASMPAALELARRRNAGWVYATPQAAPNPYGLLPAEPYWTNEVTGAAGVTVDARASGATGNGITDDTAALKNAIGGLAATGGTLALPAGTYQVRASGLLGVPAGVTLAGAPGAVIRSGEYGFNELSVTGSAATIKGITVEGSGMVVRGLTIGSGSSQVVIQDTTIRDIAQPPDPGLPGYSANSQQTVAGIRIEGGLDHVTILRTTVSNVRAVRGAAPDFHPTARGLWITPASATEHVATGVTVDSSTVDEVGPKDDGDCLVIQSGPQDAGVLAGLKVIDNSFDHCHKRALKIQVGGALISGNRINNPYFNDNRWTTYPAAEDNFDMYSAISVLASNVSVTGNHIGGIGSFYNGIEADAQAPSTLANIAITGNDVTMGAGSRIFAPSSSVRALVGVSGLTITGNSLTHAQVGVYVQLPAGPSPVIAGNVIRDIGTPYFCGSLACPGSTLALSASPAAITVSRGTASVQIGISRGPDLATAPVSLTVAGAPAGMAATLSPTATTYGAAALSIQVASAAPGRYTLTVTGTAGPTSSDLKLTVNVSPAPAPSPSPRVSPAQTPRPATATPPLGGVT